MSNVIAKTAAAVLTLMLATAAWGQNATPEFGAEDNYLDRVRVDRYLDVEIWTNHADGDYLVGDEIEISFRANRDAFVVIYTVDSRGRVNMLFPSIEGGDNYVHGGVTYRLPDEREDYDLVVTGPEGIENIQAIASRERIAIPDWYPNSGLECDWDDRHDFMDYVNGRYFLRYEGQRLAFDRAALNIYDWEREYYRPVYVPRYPSWTLCGNVYVDYYHGSSIYIDGVYWGCAPLYMPRLYVGWHTFTVYDRWGHCWEHDVHVSRFHTVVLDRQVVVTRPATVSKYKEVRFAGYRDPIRHGYPKFDKTKLVASKPAPGVGGRKNVVSRTTTKTVTTTTTKKYVRGNGAVVKTERGLESVGSPSRGLSKRSESRFSTSSRSTSKSESSVRKKSSSSSSSSSRGSSSKRTRTYETTSSPSSKSGSSYGTSKKSSGSSSSSGYYQRKSGESKRSATRTVTNSGSKKSTSSGSTKSSTVTKKSSSPPPTKSAGSSKKSSGGGSKSKGKSRR